MLPLALKKRVLFLETTNATPHLETSFEIAKIHLVNNDIVNYCFLGHAVSYSEMVVSVKNVLHPSLLPEQKGASLLSCHNFTFTNVARSELDIYRFYDIPDFLTTEQLRSFVFKNYQAGLSALSSLVSLVGDPNPDLREHSNLLEEILISGLSIYCYSLNCIKELKPDLVYLFNGRFANNRAIMDACIKTDTPFLIHERGSDPSSYIAWPHMPHDRFRVMILMKKRWEYAVAESNEYAYNLAKSFFHESRAGVSRIWHSYVSQQRRNCIPHQLLNCRKRVISYFASSDDEFVAVGDFYEWDRWGNQLHAINDLIDIVSNDNSLFLAIRLHPRMQSVGPNVLKQWKNLSLPSNAMLVDPEDTLSTYELIDLSDVVVTCGSTVGIEAVYWGKPSICLGPSLYECLDAVYMPKDKLSLARLLTDRSLSVNPDDALPYGYYISTFGHRFKYYIPSDLGKGVFLGVDLQSFGFNPLVRRLARFCTRCRRMLPSF